MPNTLVNYDDALGMWLRQNVNPGALWWQTNILLGCQPGGPSYDEIMYYLGAGSNSTALIAVDQYGIGYWDLSGQQMLYRTMHPDYHCILLPTLISVAEWDGAYGVYDRVVTLQNALIGPPSSNNGDGQPALPHSGRPIAMALSLSFPTATEGIPAAGDRWFAYATTDIDATQEGDILAGLGISPWDVPDVSVTFV